MMPIISGHLLSLAWRGEAGGGDLFLGVRIGGTVLANAPRAEVLVTSWRSAAGPT